MTVPKTLYFAIQSRLVRDADGRVRARVAYARYEAWAGFLGPFDELVLIARVEPERAADGALVEGPGVRVLEVPFFLGPMGILRRWTSLRRFFRATITDRDAFYGSRIPNILGALLQSRARKLGAPFLAQLVGDPVEVLRSGVGGIPGRIGSSLAGVVTRRSVRRADAAIYVTRETLQRRYPAGPRALTLSRSNVELGEEAFAAAPRDYDASPVRSPLRILTAGTQEQMYKGHDVLIDSVALLKEQGLDASAVIVGGGRFHDQLVQRTVDRGVADRVTFTGTLPGAAEVRRHMREADVFVLPSRTEGLPRVLIEAMAAGVVSVGSAVGGVPELLGPDCLVPPGDSRALARTIRALVEDPRRSTAAASAQWHRAAEIRADRSGDELLSRFLERWIARAESRGTT